MNALTNKINKMALFQSPSPGPENPTRKKYSKFIWNIWSQYLELPFQMLYYTQWNESSSQVLILSATKSKPGLESLINKLMLT